MTARRPTRMALRTAVVVSILAGIQTFWLDVGLAGFYTTLGAFCLIAMSDFRGPRKDRFLANIYTGLAGTALVAIGSLINFSFYLTLAVSFILMFAIAYSVVLRGYIGAAFPTLVLPYVVAATTPQPLSALPATLLAFFIGCVIAAFASILLWPTYETSELRKLVAASLKASANFVGGSRPLNPDAKQEAIDTRMRQLVAVNNDLETVYKGKVARPGSATVRDRGLVQLVEDVKALRVSLRWPDSATAVTESDRTLLKSVQETLDACGDAMTGDGPIPSPDGIVAARTSDIKGLPQVASEFLAKDDQERLQDTVNTGFYYRISAFLTSLIVRHTQLALQSEHKIKNEPIAFSSNRTVEMIELATSPKQILRSHFNVESPWFRRAIQTAVAITVAIGIVNYFHLLEGFWVVLGITGALQFDATNTRKTALWSGLGTLLGFVVIWLLLLAIGNNAIPLMILLPFAAFLAPWFPPGTKHVVLFKQIGYTVLFIILTALAQGFTFQLDELRVQDLGLGLLICVGVASLMWPRGVASQVRDVLKKSVHATTDYFVAAYTYITSARTTSDQAALEDAIQTAVAARIRADDAYDVAISQGGEAGISAQSWSLVANAIDHVFFASTLVCSLQKYGLTPVPDADVARHLREDSRRIATDYAQAIDVTYEIVQPPSTKNRGSATAATSYPPAADPKVLHPHTDSDGDLAEVNAAIASALSGYARATADAVREAEVAMNPATAEATATAATAATLQYEVEQVPFSMNYGTAAVSLLWTRNWLGYFHWLAAHVEEQTAASIPPGASSKVTGG